MKRRRKEIKNKLVVILILSFSLFSISPQRLSATSFLNKDMNKKIPIIIVPGLFGSVLYEDKNDNNKMDEGEEISPNFPKLFWSIKDEHLKTLLLDQNGNDLPGSKIRVGNILGKLEISKVPILGLFLPDQPLYDSLASLLESLGYSVFPFTYDWRKDIRQSAERLENLIEEKSKETPNGKVILIGHSLGGLISRYAVVRNEKVAKMVDKIIMIGTPNCGSPMSYFALKFGLKGRGINKKQAQNVIQNFPSLYQSLPNQDFFNLYGPIFEKEEKNLTIEDTYLYNPNSALENQSLVQIAKEFWQEIDAWDKPGKIPENIKTYLISGKDIPTSIKIIKRKRFLREKYYREYADGDEEIPILSSERLIGPNIIKLPRISKASHQGMPANKDVQKVIAEILTKEKIEEK
ncbi:MAG TPA: alpha/beta hydrolase [Candidatus Pacearchaeota archaeon]|nr:alpha/beta hydrolase [Candidatus Pacearchaeota archaeon]HOK94341.1 alpha/beta hydrolase [Candidatus Pacearchaeota archaeon]HPO75292.1 alpha/beta hydrolase [Candidatus Pacearchaeota archaeon]